MLASVIGRGGFLGSAVSVALHRFAIPEYRGKSKLSWPSEYSSFQIELFKRSLDLYLEELGELQSDRRIAVFWCAGRSFPRSNYLEVELDRLLFDLVIGSVLKKFGGPNLHVSMQARLEDSIQTSPMVHLDHNLRFLRAPHTD